MIRLKFIYAIVSVVFFITIFSTSDAFSQSHSTIHLGIMPTAETLGKGGYSTSIGMFKYEELEPNDPVRNPIIQEVVIGNFFAEKHKVEYHADAELLPVKLTFGVSEYVDFYLGGTYSVGDSYKTIADYYETGDDRERVYSQFLFDGTVGLKYNIKPELGDGLPALSIGGEIQTGYTSDDRTSERNFIDETPADSFPFVGMGTYLVGSQNLQLVKLHAAVGMFLSSKSPRVTDSFKLSVQGGGELMLAENLALIADFTTARMYSGVNFKSLFSVGFRYNLSERAAFSVSFATASSKPGFQFNLFVGGEKARPLAPEIPETGREELLF
ncbi:TPA: hypothetical protein EYP66_04780 [Candidatus Poribacteria bacterium]|nr:hypothetical protein [Candidatus Poribacteria bacterium]